VHVAAREIFAFAWRVKTFTDASIKRGPADATDRPPTNAFFTSFLQGIQEKHTKNNTFFILL
jgi:hypothetical protein